MRENNRPRLRNVVTVAGLTVATGVLIAFGWAAWWVLSGRWLGGPIPSSRERFAILSGIPLRSQPLIAAVKRFQADHGRPPKDLQELVPKYLPTIPDTGVARFPSYQYVVYPHGGLDPFVWYDLGPTEVECSPDSSEESRIGIKEHAVLIVWLHSKSEGRVQDASAERLPEGDENEPFDPGLWRRDTISRRRMVASFLNDVRPQIKTKDDLINWLGEPDGARALWVTPWELSVKCHWGFWEASRVYYWPTEKYPNVPRIHIPLRNWAFVDESI